MKQNLAPMWKKLMKDVDIEEHHFSITFTYDALNGNANQTRKLLDTRRRCLNSVFLLEQPKNYQDGTNLAQKLQRGPTTWRDMLENAWNGISNWQTRRRSIFSKFLILVWTITKSKRKKVENNCELSEVCSHTVLKCLYLERSGRPDILWSVNKLARSVTKWTQSCGRRLARLISYIHVTTAKFVMWAMRLNIVDWASGGVLCILGSRTFVPISWMCKKQTSVSHSSTESEIIPLDARLRMDGLPTCARLVGFGY